MSVHRFGKEQAKNPDMDEETRRIRKERMKERKRAR